MEKDKLISFITSRKSSSDGDDVLEWIESDDRNKDEYVRYKNLWAILQNGKTMSAREVQSALSSVKKKLPRKKKTLKLWSSIAKYAAIIVIAILIGFYANNSRDTNTQISMNEVFVPNGNRSIVKLPDGTTVWISNGTKLIYPKEFEGKNRNVELIGEGFFDVAHDKEHPFILKLGENRIKVLGTKFSVAAYPDDELVEAELVSGRIQFDFKSEVGEEHYRSIIMTPSQRLVYDKNTGEVEESKFDDEFYEYWMKGIYHFKDETFENLAHKIERIYNVKVTFEEKSLKERRYSGTFSIDDNIYTLLEVLKQAADGQSFSYTHENNHVIIKNMKK